MGLLVFPLMAQPELRVEGYLATYFRQRGWLVYKMDQGGGVADRLMVSPKGYHLWVELKKPGKDTLDPAQVLWAGDMVQRLNNGWIERMVTCAEVIGPVNSRRAVEDLYDKYKDH